MTPGTPDPDLDLVRALQAGDDAALDALMERHQGPIFRFVHGYVVNEADAVELTQETFVRAYFNIRKFQPTAKFGTWLYRIALNLCRDHAKSRRVKNAVITDSISPPIGEAGVEKPLRAAGKTPVEEAELAEKMRALDIAITQLPHDLRAALVLTAIEQHSHQHCAELLATTPKTIENRVYRARKLLAELMSKAGF